MRWRYQRYMHDYLACVKAVDESVGRVLAALDEEGLADNTIVVYCSDQGFFLGEHGWFDKRWIFEESLRTPLLVRWPKVIRPGSVNADLVSNVDFAQTLAGGGRRGGARRDARPRPGAAFARPHAGRLAEEFLLSLLRVSGAAPCAAALRSGDRSLQARPFLLRRRLLGAVRPERRSAGAAQRLGQAGVRGGRKGIDRRAGAICAPSWRFPTPSRRTFTDKARRTGSARLPCPHAGYPLPSARPSASSLFRRRPA